ncbi:MAG: hypothetical protein J6Y58_00640 [Clostridiales bacterium]|nr:hypothetical protein [Clostridiales bacterium]
MKKPVTICVICVFLIAGLSACLYYLSTHDLFKPDETVTLTKSAETVATPETTDTYDSKSSDLSEVSDDAEDVGKQLDAIGDIDARAKDGKISITIPKDLMGNVTQKQIDEAVAQDDGFISGTVNADGSVTYVMTKEKYIESVKTMQKGIEESLQETINSPECPHIISISHNEDYSKYTVMCSSDDLTLNESMLALQLYIYSGMYYQFLINPPDNVYLTYINSNTGKTIYESNAKELSEQK